MQFANVSGASYEEGPDMFTANLQSCYAHVHLVSPKRAICQSAFCEERVKCPEAASTYPSGSALRGLRLKKKKPSSSSEKGLLNLEPEVKLNWPRRRPGNGIRGCLRYPCYIGIRSRVLRNVLVLLSKAILPEAKDMLRSVPNLSDFKAEGVSNQNLGRHIPESELNEAHQSGKSINVYALHP